MRRFIALVCLVLFLALELFASAPALHKLIHSDAASADHSCAITLFSHGNVNAADTSVVVVVVVAAALFSLSILPSADIFTFRLPSFSQPRSSCGLNSSEFSRALSLDFSD